MKTLITTIIATTFLMSAGTSFAQDGDDAKRSSGHGKAGQRGQRSMQGMPMMDHFTRALRHLDLSEDQKVSIRATMQTMKTEIRPIIGEMKAGQLQLTELIKADQYDEDAVAELAAKEGDLAAERILIASRALSTMFNQLTDEQRVDLDEMAAKRMERRSEKRRQRTREG